MGVPTPLPMAATPPQSATSSTKKPSQPQCRLRPATPEDAPAIASLGATTFHATFSHSCTAEQMQAFLDSSYTPALILADIEDPNKDVIVAVDTNDTSQILGFSYLTRLSTSSEPALKDQPGFPHALAELQRLYVSRDAHGKGVGSALSRKIADMAKEQGFEKLWLGVWQENYKALGMYEHWGYAKVGTHDFDVGGDLQTDWIMVKDL